MIIQIINYNTKKYLINCIESVINDLSSSKLTYSINILDNNSNDDLEDIQDKFNQPNINFFFSDINLGFGGGHNYLTKKSDSDYILILNPDIEFTEKNTINRLLSVIKSNTRIAVIGPGVISENNKALEYDHGELKGLKAWYKLNIGEALWKERNEPADVAWVSGAFSLIRRKYYTEVNGFDDKYFMYKEEEDLCYRLRNAGYKIHYYPLVKIFHHSEVTGAKSKYIDISRKYFIEKNLKHKPVYRILSILRKIISVNTVLCLIEFVL